MYIVKTYLLLTYLLFKLTCFYLSLNYLSVELTCSIAHLPIQDRLENLVDIEVAAHMDLENHFPTL